MAKHTPDADLHALRAEMSQEIASIDKVLAEAERIVNADPRFYLPRPVRQGFLRWTWRVELGTRTCARGTARTEKGAFKRRYRAYLAAAELPLHERLALCDQFAGDEDGCE